MTSLSALIEAVVEPADFTLPTPPVHDHIEKVKRADLDTIESEFQKIAQRAAAEWGSGWPNCQGSMQVSVFGGGVRVNCRREIALLVKMLLDESVRRGYKIRQADTGAFVCRPIGGTRTASNHSWGLAIDINWQSNGFGYNVPHDIPDWMIALWKSYGFSYGGDWSGKKDWMHFEWIRGKADAERFTKLALSALGKPVAPPVVEPPKPQFGRYFHPMVGGFWSSEENNMKTGLYIVGADGGVFTLGPGAIFHGSAGGIKLASPVVGGAPHPSGNGYWLVAADGGVFCFGNARFYGSMGGVPLTAPVVDIVPTFSGNGYTMVAADGGTFTFGDALFLGSLAQVKLHKPIIEAHGTRSGQGMFLLGEDGGVFTFGDAVYFESAVAKVAGRRAVSMALTPSERGAWMACDDYTIFNLGDAPDWGSPTPGKYKVTRVLVSKNGGVVLAEDGGVNRFGGEVEWWGSVA